MFNKIIDKWKEIAVIMAIAGLAFNFYVIQSNASEAKQKVEKFEETFANIAQIAHDLQDPNVWLKNYLILNGVDSVDASAWAVYPRGIPRTSDDRIILFAPYIELEGLPEIGVLKILQTPPDSVAELKMLLDTLWDFRSKE